MPGQQPPPYGQQPYAPPPAYGQGYGAPSAERYSTWPTRALGGLVDYVAPTVAFYILYFIVAVGIGGGVGAFLGFVVLLALIGFQLWNTVFKQGTTGQSLGKELAKTKLIAEQTGLPLGAGMTFVRQLAHIVDSLICYIGWLFPLWDQKRQTLADKIMHSVVVPVGEAAQQPGYGQHQGYGQQQGY